jgi:lysylphosphatidylglycerol synthetase-like protein (DUF2156 family)
LQRSVREALRLAGEHDHQTLVLLARDEDRKIKGALHFVPVYARPAMPLSFMRRDPGHPQWTD